MAKKGLRYVKFFSRHEYDDAEYYSYPARVVSFGGFKVLSPAVAFNGSMQSGSAKDYGDDVMNDISQEVSMGTLTVELNDESDDMYTFLLGHRQRSGVITSNVDDDPGEFGVGAVGQSGDRWVGIFYPRVKFREPNDDNSTRQENVTFGHIVIEGDILIPEYGHVWKLRKSFATFDAAKAWIDRDSHPSWIYPLGDRDAPGEEEPDF